MTAVVANERPVVLVAEDDEDILALVSLCLGDEYELLTARDGREALAMAIDEHPDLAVLDLKMPELSGYEVIRAIRESESAGDGSDRMQVMILSAYARQRAGTEFDEGADDYMSKPFDPGELLRRTEALLQSR
jgi:two-component system KDP operon response regulator KdpE